jgi:hypothetical protein
LATTLDLVLVSIGVLVMIDVDFGARAALARACLRRFLALSLARAPQ